MHNPSNIKVIYKGLDPDPASYIHGVMINTNNMKKWSNSYKDDAFTCNRNSGFSMAVNGFRISIQFGPSNYIADGDIRFRTEQDAPMSFVNWGTDTAEVLIWDRNDVPITWDGGDQVIGWVTSDTVGRLIGCLASCPPDFDPTAALNQIASNIRP